MKEEALKAHVDAVVAADAALYDAGFADGVASLPPAPVLPDVQAKIDAAVLAKGQADQVALDGLKAQLDASVAADAQDKLVIQAKQDVIDKIKALLG